MTRQFAAYAALAVLCLVLFAWRLGAVPLMGLDEGLYSECAREMASGAGWLVPKVNGIPFYEKPPLAYWLTAASIRIFGPNSFAARLPSCLAGLTLVALTVWIGTKIFGRRAGLCSGIAFATCIMSVALARMALMDMLFALLITAALGTFVLTHVRMLPRAYYVVFWVAAGLSVLVKGPAGAVLIAVTVLAFAAIRRKARVLADAMPLVGLAVFGLVALPWYAAVGVHTHGEFLREFIVHQNLQRALGQDFQHNMPFYFYIPTFLFGFFPWSVFVPLAWARYVRSAPTDSADEAALFAGVWTAAVVVIFSVSRSKLPAYIYPIYPASALLVGRLWSDAFDQPAADSLRRYAAAAVVLAVVIGGALLIGPRFLPEPVPGAGVALGAMGGSLAAGPVLCLLMLVKRGVKPAFGALCAGTAAFALCAVVLALPVASRALGEPAVAAAERIRRLVPRRQPVFAYRLSPPQSTLPFYAGRPIPAMKTEEELREAIRGLKSFAVVGQNDRLEGLPSGGRLVTRVGRYVIYRFEK